MRQVHVVKDRGKEKEDVCVRVKGLKNLFVVEDLEFFLVGFDGEFAVGVFAPDDAARIAVRVEGFRVGAGLEGCGEDDGFGTDHVEDDGDSPETVAELFPKVARETGFSSRAEDEYSDCGSVHGGFSQAVNALGRWV